MLIIVIQVLEVDFLVQQESTLHDERYKHINEVDVPGNGHLALISMTYVGIERLVEDDVSKEMLMHLDAYAIEVLIGVNLPLISNGIDLQVDVIIHIFRFNLNIYFHFINFYVA